MRWALGPSRPFTIQGGHGLAGYSACETAKGPCAIPFVVDFITYKTCTNLRSEYYWCSLTPHYGGDSKEPCPETCLSAGARRVLGYYGLLVSTRLLWATSEY